MKKRFYFFIFVSSLLISCSINSNKTDVRFMGVNLNSPCEVFLKNLEDNGFIVKTWDNKKRKTNPDYPELKGKFLGENVTIKMGDKVDGHYKDMALTAAFSNDYDQARHFFKKVCKKIRSEHSGFEEDEKNSNGVDKIYYYSEDKGFVKLLFSSSSIGGYSAAIIYVTLDTGEKVEESLDDIEESLKPLIDDNHE